MKTLTAALALALAPAIAAGALTEQQRLDKAMNKYAGKQPCVCAAGLHKNQVGWLQTETVTGLEDSRIEARCRVVSFDLQGALFSESFCDDFVVPAK